MTGLWYEPGTDALRLLEPLEGPWIKLLPPMLSTDPAKRPVKLVEFLRKTRTNTVRPHKTVLTRLAIIGCLFAVIVATLMFYPTRSSTRLNTSPSLFLDLGSGVRIEMVECTATDGQRFWIGASHVTNAEWRRMTGNGRDGADDEPAVAMSMTDIVHSLCQRLVHTISLQ